MIKMKAALCKQYGPPEVLQIQDVNRPVFKENEILVRIMAAPVNTGDVRVRGLEVSGILKVMMQLAIGFSRPRRPILGTVYAGIIEETGTRVSSFKKGDKVFGMTDLKFGTHAEYISVGEKSTISQMPAGASYEEAASLPFGWHTAFYFLKKAGIHERNKPKVLIYGATGSVGLAAVQWVGNFDAALTAVCSSKGKPLMEMMGINNVIAYDLEDFTQTTYEFDIIFDAVGKTSKSICKHLLDKGGSFVSVGGLDMATAQIAHLKLIQQLWEKGRCRAIIDRIYPFKEIIAAHAYVDTGRKKGEVVVTMY